MKVTVERAHAAEIAGPRPPCRRATQHHSHSRQRADPRRKDGKLSLKATDLDLEVTETLAGRGGAPAARPPCRRICSTTSCANCRTARRSCWRPPATAPSCAVPRRALALHAADAAGERLPRSRRGRDDALDSNCRPPTLKRLIDRTQFAISTEETRYYLNGIYLHTAGSATRPRRCARVATDGHRLAQSRDSICPRARPACRASSCRARRSARCSA